MRRRSGRRHPKRGRSRLLRATLALASVGLLAVAGAALAMSASAALHNAPVTSAAAAVTDTSGGTSSGGDWIPLHSQTASDVIAAVRQSPLLDPSAGQTLDLSHLGTPLLVYGLAARDGGTLPDAYVVPVLNHTGRAAGAIEAELNASATALRVEGIVTFARTQPAAIMRLGATQAVAQVSRQRGVALRSGEQPQLIYFPVDSEAQTLGTVKWSAGGEYPADPIWRVPGADGKDYFVGTDGTVYTLAQLPRAATTAG